jgi:two-component system, OmpR family, sensor histidine kinase ChvG
VLCGYLESSERRAREQIWLGLRDRAAAIAHTFTTEQLNDRTRTAGRSAQLAGFSAETGGTTPRPALAPLTPTPEALAAPIPSVAMLEPTGFELARAAEAGAQGWLLTTSYWETPEMRLAAFACLSLVALAILLAVSILRSLRRFREAADEIVFGRVGDEALTARNGVRELSGVARLLDSLVFDLRYMSDQVRLTAEENAHSLRTPLATMRTALGAIQRSLPPDEPRAQRALKIIDISLDRMSNVVNSAQRNDMTMADLVAAPRDPVDLAELTRDVLGEAGGRAQARNILFREKLPDAVIVHANSPVLKTALQDVLTSAVNASPRYGEIAVTLEAGHTDAHLTVEDRGCDGDAPELFFQPDFLPSSQANPQAPDQAHPFRLGLWNVKRIVEAFGGQVTADHNNHGGISVSIMLPCDWR